MVPILRYCVSGVPIRCIFFILTFDSYCCSTIFGCVFEDTFLGLFLKLHGGKCSKCSMFVMASF